MTEKTVIEAYVDQSDWRGKENANEAYSISGLSGHIARTAVAKYALNDIYTPEIRDAHLGGTFYIHDLGLGLEGYCVGLDLKQLLTEGLVGVVGKTASAPPKHFRTALGQLVNWIFLISQEVAGAVAISSFDTFLAPFVRADGLTYEQVKQDMQEFIYNINQSTRIAFQTPFSNVTMDLTATGPMAEEHAIVGGKKLDTLYGEYQHEMDMINSAFAEVMTRGDAQGNVFTFPIPTYNITKNFNWENPVLYPLWKMTAKYGIPYFANFVNSDMQPEDVRSMCPLDGEELILSKDSKYDRATVVSIERIWRSHKNKKCTILSNGQWETGSFHQFEKQDMSRIVLATHHELITSNSHLNFVKKGKNMPIEELTTKELLPGMYLPYSTKVLPGTGGTFELGYVVGCFAGDGSFDRGTTVFSLNQTTKAIVAERIQYICTRFFGADCSVVDKDSLRTLRVYSKSLEGLINDFVEGMGTDKKYTDHLYSMSEEFRRGVLEGHLATDGGNRNRIYTSSPNMVKRLNLLAASLGTFTSVLADDREGRYGTATNYAVLIHIGRPSYGDEYFTEDGFVWSRIEKIIPDGNRVAYCFETDSDTQMFTVATTGIVTHNCRLRIDTSELLKRGGLFSSNPTTGSIGVVTINLPHIARETKDEGGGSELFYKKLIAAMDLAALALNIKRTVVETNTKRGLFPYMERSLRHVKENMETYWANHFNSIGLIGMNECVELLTSENITEPNGAWKAEEILDEMLSHLKFLQQQYGVMFNLEATPAETATYVLAKTDLKRWPDMLHQGTPEAPYYTNSALPPVNFTSDLWEYMRAVDNILPKFTGGSVVHVYLGEALPDPLSVKELVKHIATSYKVPYFSITPTFSICPIHGYLYGAHEYCPKCDAESIARQETSDAD